MHGEWAYLFQGLGAGDGQEDPGYRARGVVRAGGYSFRENGAALNFYVLSEGRIRLTVGSGQLLAYVASSVGDIIGWSSLVDNGTYTASAECLSPTKLLRIEKHQLDQVMREDPVSGMVFFKHLAALVGHRLVGAIARRSPSMETGSRGLGDKGSDEGDCRFSIAD